MNKYSEIVKTFKLRKYYKGSKRFSAKKFITQTLPRRLKNISKIQPDIFRSINEISKTPKIAIEKIFEKEKIRLEKNQRFFERFKNENYKYKPNLMVKILLKSNNLRNFNEHLNEYLSNLKQTRGLMKHIKENSTLFDNQSPAEQNRRLFLYFNKLSDKRRENKLLNIITDSDKLIELVADELSLELDKNNTDDYDYLFEDEDY